MQYINIISIIHAAFKYVIKFILYSTGPLYNTLNHKMIKRNLYMFPHSLFLHWINYHFILLLTLTDIIATVITSHKFISPLQSESVVDMNSTIQNHKHQ